MGVLRLDMDGVALSNTWFAISPLNTAIDALWLLRQDASPLGGGWRTQVQEVVRNRGLTLLASLFGGSWDYVPDFLTPQPGAPEPTVQAELHALATTDSQRLQWEIALMFQGSTEHGMLGRPVPSVVRDALERGEHAFAERLASEIDQVWRPAIAPHWVSLRARMEADISQRAQTVARHGLSSMLTGLHPRVVWNVDHLQLMTRFRGRACGSTGLVLTPSVFAGDLHIVIDSSSIDVQRQPMLAYPALRGLDVAPPPARTAHALLGVTRARLLSDLQCARTTAELGERHFLSTSTVSYHLGILHRSGLVTRNRKGHRVLYEQTSRAASLLIDALNGGGARS